MIFVFLVFTIVSSLLSAVVFVTGNNLAFALKKGDGGNGGSSDSGGGSSDKGSGNGGGSSDNTAGGGSDNSNGGASSTDNTATSPPPTTDETTQAPPTTEESTPPPAANQQKTCPDGTMVDDSSNCPPPTNTPVQPQVKQVEVPANPDGSCPPGSFPVGSAGNAGQPGTGSSTCLSNAPPAGRPTDTPPATPTQQKLAPLQTLTPQQTCKDGSTPDANGICQDGSTPVETPPATSPSNTSPPKLIGNGVYELATVPPEPTAAGIPSCPSGSHLVLFAKCVVNGASCPSGTVQINPLHCGPQPIATPPKTCPDGETLSPKGNCVSGTIWLNLINGTLIELGNGRYQLQTYQPVPNTNTIAPICPQFSHLEGSNCVKNGAVCPPGTVQDDGALTCSPLKPFKQVEVPANPDGRCPEGAYNVGSSGNAGQPGTGSITCFKNIPLETPPATPPTNTPPAQPQPTPSQPVCELGFHWDASQRECVPNGPK